MQNEDLFETTFPPLVGSKEQQPWAQVIRLPIIIALAERIQAHFPHELDQEALTLYLEILLGRYTRASWWIEFERNFMNPSLVDYFWNELSWFLQMRQMQLDHQEEEAKLIIFDIGNTITNVPFIDKQPLHILPGRRKTIVELLQKGKLVAFCENRGEVPYGMRTEQQVLDEIDKIMHDLLPEGCEYPFSTVCFACERPEKLSPGRRFNVAYATPEMLARRKPNTGMFEEAANFYHVRPHEIDVVGDSWEDLEAARRFHARTFYDTSVYFGEKALPDPPAQCEKIFNW